MTINVLFFIALHTAKKNIGNGYQMCKKHQADYEKGKKLKAFYGKSVQKNSNIKKLKDS
jgi:hypothetical protein